MIRRPYPVPTRLPDYGYRSGRGRIYPPDVLLEPACWKGKAGGGYPLGVRPLPDVPALIGMVAGDYLPSSYQIGIAGFLS
jgi:hypothetical protein